MRRGHGGRRHRPSVSVQVIKGMYQFRLMSAAKKREAQNAEDQQEQADENMHEDDNPEGSGSSRREAEPNSAADKTVKQRQAQDAEEEQEQADEDMREDDNPEGSGFARQEAEPNSAAAKRLRGVGETIRPLL